MELKAIERMKIKEIERMKIIEMKINLKYQVPNQVIVNQTQMDMKAIMKMKMINLLR